MSIGMRHPKSFDTDVLIGIDTETDVGSFTPFYEGVKKGVPLLIDLFEDKGIKSTFFYTGEAAEKNPGSVLMAKRAGHEIGCHSLWHETVGDELFPIPGVKPLLPSEVKPRLTLAADIIGSITGERPVSFRAPRLWGSTALINTLEELGYICDASYPLYFFRQQFEPYHPSSKNWTQKGDMKILEIPNFADMTMVSLDGELQRDRDQWPLIRIEGGERFFQKCRDFADFVRGKGLRAVLCIYIHPWEFIEVEKSYHFGEATVIPDPIITDNCGERALAELGIWIDMMLDAGAVFHRFDDFAKNWK